MNKPTITVNGWKFTLAECAGCHNTLATVNVDGEDRCSGCVRRIALRHVQKIGYYKINLGIRTFAQAQQAFDDLADAQLALLLAPLNHLEAHL